VALIVASVMLACTVPTNRSDAESAGRHELQKYCEEHGLRSDAFRIVDVSEAEPGWTVEFENTRAGLPRRLVFIFKKNGFVETSVDNQK
jgi:hypothetical protein